MHCCIPPLISHLVIVLRKNVNAFTITPWQNGNRNFPTSSTSMVQFQLMTATEKSVNRKKYQRDVIKNLRSGYNHCIGTTSI